MATLSVMSCEIGGRGRRRGLSGLCLCLCGDVSLETDDWHDTSRKTVKTHPF